MYWFSPAPIRNSPTVTALVPLIFYQLGLSTNHFDRRGRRIVKYQRKLPINPQRKKKEKEGYCKFFSKSRKGPDTVRSLSAGQQDQKHILIFNSLERTLERTVEGLLACWPAERLPTVSGPFLDVSFGKELSIDQSQIGTMVTKLTSTHLSYYIFDQSQILAHWWQNWPQHTSNCIYPWP